MLHLLPVDNTEAAVLPAETGQMRVSLNSANPHLSLMKLNMWLACWWAAPPAAPSAVW